MRLTAPLTQNNLFLAAALLVAMVVGAPECARAAVNTTGDVKPSGTSFGTIFTDDDGDNISDVIDDQGNNVFDFLADPTDPDAASGTNGLPWNADQIWVDYESRQNILVGETGSGFLEINGASALRYQHLVLGGVSDVFTGGQLDLTAAASSNDFDFNMDLNSSTLPTSGFGQVTVTGFGSVFNNDPDVVPTEFITALTATTAIADTQAAVTFLEGVTGARSQSTGDEFDVHVGLLGGGALNVEAGGRVETQDALFVGLGYTAIGTVTVTGAGSVLSANGREEIDYSNGDSMPTLEFSSIIGGHGSGTLNITEGGRVDMFNGASLGGSNSTTLLQGGNASQAGSGTVLLSGIGSNWNVYASRAIHDGNNTLIGLAVGDLTNNSNDAIGSGLLRIGEGSTVNVAFTNSYIGTNAASAKMVIGSVGNVEMQGGSLHVGDALTNDGTLDGYGTVTSGKFYNGALGNVVVSAGERLTIRSNLNNATNEVNGFDPSTSAIEIHTDSDLNGVVDGAAAVFYQANLGSIRVEGGELELGRSQPTDPLAPVDRENAFLNARYATVDNSNLFVINPTPSPGDPSSAFTGVGTQVGDSVVGTITANGGTLSFKSGLYNTGIVNFTGGDNSVVGKVLNGSFDYDNASDSTLTSVPFDHDNNAITPDKTFDAVNHELILPGVLLISGDQTSVTFEDDVTNDGIISIGPSNNVARFLGDLTNNGTIQITSDLNNGGNSLSAAIVVTGDVEITSGKVSVTGADLPGNTFPSLATAGGAAATAASAGFSMTLLTAGGDLSDESMFTDLDLPGLDSGLYWDVIYDTSADEILLEIVASSAFGADFNGDGVVNTADLGVWNANAGITSGASIIQGDADLDGDVDLGDYLLLSQQMFDGVPVAYGGGGGGGSPIPEPSTLLLAMLAVAPFATHRS